MALDLREGHASGSWAPRKHEPSPRRRGLGPSGRDAAESGDGGLPPPSLTESAVRVGAPQPPLPSRGAEIRGKCGVDVRNASYSRFGPATADRGSRGIRDQPRNPPKYTEKRIRINFPFPCPSRGRAHARRVGSPARRVGSFRGYAFVMTFLAGVISVVIKDADGNVIKDTRAERLTEHRAFRDQCLRHAEDPLLQDLLASFRQAVADPADRMTHLYDIRDALNRHFGGEKTARNQLGLTHKEWSDLGRIANKEPIEESRHRGCHPALRPAAEDEQSRVLVVIRSMIRA